MYFCAVLLSCSVYVYTQILIQNHYLYTTVCGGNQRVPVQIEVRECLLSFGAESFVFQVAIQKLKKSRYIEL